MARPGKRIARSNYGNKWVNPGRTRVCPACLHDSSHPIWKTLWITPWALACTIHGTLLLDHCPGCGIPIGDPGPGVVRSLIPKVASPVEHPAACRTATARANCNYRLDQAETGQAHPDLLNLQHRLDQAILSATTESNQWLRDLRLIALLLIIVGNPVSATTTPYADAARRHIAERQSLGAAKSRDQSIPPSSVEALTGILLAAAELNTSAETSEILADLNAKATAQAPTAWEEAKNMAHLTDPWVIGRAAAAGGRRD